MLNDPTYDKRTRVKLFGIARAFAEQSALDLDHLGFEERLGLWTLHEILKHLAKIDVLVIVDWGLAVRDDAHRRDLLEVLDERTAAARPSSPASLLLNVGIPPTAKPTLSRRHPRPPGSQCSPAQVEGDSLQKKRAGLTNATGPG